jgi:hypothetical protein
MLAAVLDQKAFQPLLSVFTNSRFVPVWRWINLLIFVLDCATIFKLCLKFIVKITFYYLEILLLFFIGRSLSIPLFKSVNLSEAI